MRATLEIDGFRDAADAVRFITACGLSLRAPRPDPTRVIGCAIMAHGTHRIGTVHMLRKGVTLRIDMTARHAAWHATAILERLAQRNA